MAFMGRVRRLITLVETDDIAALDSEVAALTRLADELREPTHRWNLLEIRGGLALREGRFDEAERFIHQTFALGEQLQKVDAGPIFTGQLLALRRARGRADEMEAAIRSQIEQFPEIAYWRCELALLRCELGREAEARVEFEQIAAHDFLDLPRNFVWLGSIAVLSQVAALLGDRRRAASLYDLLLPYEKRWVALGTAWSWGAATRYLGLLSATMGRYADAARHFEDAQAMSARIRAVPFLALTQSDYARMLLARGEPGDREKGAELLGRAATVAESLGMKVLLERARTLGTTPQIAGPEAAKTAEQNVFRKEGDYWTIVYDGETVRLKDSKGLGYIAYLLQHPGTEFHAAELVGTLDGRSDAGDAGALLDPKAKAAYRRRLEELRKETEEAERFNDPGRASNARREIELLSGQLAAAIGLGGRDRKAASGAERARLTVTKRIKAVVEKIRERNQAFGRHLAKNLKTGYFCSYTPEHPVPWQN
jgi:tetratricopeptide (TPR) repeat protein